MSGAFSKTEREGLQTGSETCYEVWFGDSGINEKTGGRAEDVKMFRMDKIKNESLRGVAQLRQGSLEMKLKRRS